MNLHRCHSLALVSALCLAPLFARADTICAPLAPLTEQQRTIIHKAEQGVDALRQYIYRTRAIYQLDMMDVVGWIDARRQAEDCIAREKQADTLAGR